MATDAASNTLQKVANEFESEVLAGLEEATAQANAKLEAAKKEATASVSKISETGVRQSESLRRQIIGAAEMGARNLQLRALEAAVNEAVDAALSRIPELSASDYEKSMARLLEEGIKAMGGEATVFCGAKDEKLVASLLKKLAKEGAKVKLEAKPIDTIGGVVLAAPSGEVRFDNTFEARLERVRPILRKEVAALLSGS